MKLKITGLFFIAAAMLVPLFWLPGIASGRDTLAIFSQYLGLTALISMAILQFIATRWPGVEWIFGPLDQSYRLHKWLGLWALAATFLHDTIDADVEGGKETFLSDVAETAGEIGLNGMLILVAVTVATFIPYHLWKWTHRFIGVFFVLSVFHYMFILKPFPNTGPLGLYMLFICGVGFIAYLYTSAPRRLRPSFRYTVTELDKQGDALSVTLSPQKRTLRHKAGQFAFISFSDLGLREPHPFTLSAAPQENGQLRMTIGPLGDYTIRLMSRLEVGTTAQVEGPFGEFALARGPQTWVAAGIGITPFAAMAGSLSADSGPVKLIYSIKDRSKAVHLEELENIANANPNFTLTLWETSKQGRLNAELIAAQSESLKDKHVLYCGPSALRDSLIKELPNHGLSRRRFHYELFEIRTGIGLQMLFNYLIKRAKEHQQKSTLSNT